MKIESSSSKSLIQAANQVSNNENQDLQRNRFDIEDTVEISSFESNGNPFWYPPIQDPPPMEDDDN